MWHSRVKIKHLFTEAEDHTTVQESMAAIADNLDGSGYFLGFNTAEFRNVPEGDNVFGPVYYANKMLDGMYDYADRFRIWIA